jgi:hypothetical protein
MDMSAPAENNLISAILQEVCYPNVNETPELVLSPVGEFLVDEEAASTCPLLTPSPPADFEHPLSITPTTGKSTYDTSLDCVLQYKSG